MPSAFQQVKYLTSAFNLSQLPPDEGVEIVFAGRSNAGKSTAVNRLTQQKNLCKTSKTPGRTQLINFFSVDEEHRLVDLPGYGFAKVPVKMRRHWDTVLSGYLLQRKALAGMVIVVDIRRGLGELDLGLINLVDPQLPVHVLLTKADKLKSAARQKTLKQTLASLDSPAHTASCFSALSGLGLEQLEDRCNQLLGLNQINPGDQ
jgi:GTP-binding protein